MRNTGVTIRHSSRYYFPYQTSNSNNDINLSISFNFLI